jgi:hypothetical protein
MNYIKSKSPLISLDLFLINHGNFSHITNNQKRFDFIMGQKRLFLLNDFFISSTCTFTPSNNLHILTLHVYMHGTYHPLNFQQHATNKIRWIIIMIVFYEFLHVMCRTIPVDGICNQTTESTSFTLTFFHSFIGSNP